jgi:hypothetical protein
VKRTIGAVRNGALHAPDKIAYHPPAMGETLLDSDATAPSPSGRFSLERLSSAFARLMGAPSLAAAKAARPQIAVEADDDLTDADGDGAAVTPRMIVEAMLFVGVADGRPLTSAELAAHATSTPPKSTRWRPTQCGVSRGWGGV